MGTERGQDTMSPNDGALRGVPGHCFDIDGNWWNKHGPGSGCRNCDPPDPSSPVPSEAAVTEPPRGIPYTEQDIALIRAEAEKWSRTDLQADIDRRWLATLDRALSAHPSTPVRPDPETLAKNIEGIRVAAHAHYDEMYGPEPRPWIDEALRATPVRPDPTQMPEGWFEEQMRASFEDGRKQGRAEQVEPPSTGLDAAWAELEAALPDGWHIANLITDGPRNPGWWVQARSQMLRSDTDVYATGPTLAAALRALAARLSGPPNPTPDP